MTHILDDKAKFPSTNASIEEYAQACSDAVDEALAEWPVVETTENATVSTGFIGDNKLRSTLWTQSFDVVKEQNADGSDGSLLVLEDLLPNLKDIFWNDDVGKHAKEWDATFAGASLVGKLSETSDDDTTILVHWKFDASPLAGRDMLYLVHRREEKKGYTKHSDRTIRWTYAYASVSDEWAKNTIGKEAAYGRERRRGRASNCYPSCDRITVAFDETPGSGIKITVDHLMTTDVGGWIGPFCFNHLFKKALVRANVHECEAMREYALSLCQSNRK
mmetsp:Transcript_22922/g.48327  ORF Transcript_22922/g.48327 Transcript_22922/m.48327 type:complete len:276 (-) Transcript_22922:216-1043(-)